MNDYLLMKIINAVPFLLLYRQRSREEEEEEEKTSLTNKSSV